jgi:transposase
MFPSFGRFLLLVLLSGMIAGHDHHRRHPGPRPSVAGDPALAASTPAPLWRSSTGGRPRRPCRDRLPAAHRHPWRLLPTSQLGCGSPITCWRRLRDWQHAGVWQQLHHQLLDQLGRDSQLDWSRASLDSVSVRAKRGAS